MKIVIIGNGPAAIAAAETIRGQDRSCEIVMLSRESVPFYSPCPLAEYVEGSVPKDHLFLRDPAFYSRSGIDIRYGRPVIRIEPQTRQVWLAGNEAVAYDQLLIASGSKAFVPPIPGLATAKGVFELKTLDDAEGILERIKTARRAVVIGSGFIGLEAVQALIRQGLDVTLLEAQAQVLPAMLDREMAAIVQQRLTAHGVQVHTGCGAERILENENGVRAVMAGGCEIPCELVICAAGVRADLSILEGSGIASNRGILVNDHMQTNVDGVFAAGDIIERPDVPEKYRVLPIWPNAVSTGRIAAWNMLGIATRHPGLEAVNVVRVFDTPIASFGTQTAEDCLRWQDGNGAVRKVLLQEGRVIGGQLIGEINGTGVLHEMMKKGIAAERFGEALAHPGFSYAHFMQPSRAVKWA
ncbi:NAD(P)/FAD-dependent oxidoreductase [Azomonas macrocytogenes]|uniref:NADPH-dependent 2,4-dienoyl-CoA reductase/sulfur reductase-like enzyme n=1 Tax=Azomonas macrocytogenes TaxID=69962 RepID=A0A839T4Z6_AZOMA|nr:FAD-dependent oxidoreductase [Azomonas macrocytogenes]MBB3104158.1 NADPH-dependent 2,4-dienoyl-CoA reductase/sulfur reductase-like enzyme [Azomonas macrocytogenes]